MRLQVSSKEKMLNKVALYRQLRRAQKEQEEIDSKFPSHLLAQKFIDDEDESQSASNLKGNSNDQAAFELESKPVKKKTQKVSVFHKATKIFETKQQQEKRQREEEKLQFIDLNKARSKVETERKRVKLSYQLKTKKGQPNLNSRVSSLLEKIKKIK